MKDTHADQVFDALVILNTEVEKLRRENAAMRAALENLVVIYVANRGSDGTFPHPHEFISCKTPGDRGAGGEGSARTWAAWDAARMALGEKMRRPRRVRR